MFYYVDRIKEDEVGRLVSFTGIREMIADILWGNLNEKGQLQDLEVGGKITPIRLSKE
jgi:hypothetical protein